MSSKKKRTSVLIVTAGQSRSGKSTVLNNIFGTDYKSKYSASSVTRKVEVRCVDGHEDELITVDTPGLAARDIDMDKVKKELLDAIGGLNFVLLYCFSVSPSSPHSMADEYVVKNLTKILGKEIWKKCVVLFTSSDVLRMYECPRRENRGQYKKFIDDHAQRFHQLLRRNCGSNTHVKSVFKVDINSDKIEDIVAIPVGKQLNQRKEHDNLTPGLKIEWRDLASCLIVKKAEPLDRGVYLAFIQKRSTLNNLIAAGILGAAVGGATGAVLGLGLGGLGGIPGAVIGLGAGAAAGVAAGGVAGGAVDGATVIKKKLEKKKIEKKIHRLQQAKHIEGILDEHKNVSIQNGIHRVTDFEQSHDVIKERDPEEPDFPEEPDLAASITKDYEEINLEDFSLTKSFDKEKPDVTPYEKMI